MLKQDTKTEGISQAELKQAWGEFLTELGDRAGGWDWWATLTFRDRSDAEIARGWTKVGWKYSQGAFDQYMGFLRDLRGIGEPTWVRGREYQTWRGVPHFHALIGGVAHLRRDEAWSWWFQRYGIARIEPYDRSMGAGFYLCKYVTKELGDIQVSQGLTLKSNGVTV
ncbi:hypothetical protein ES705_46762 [subsurface metagenome]